MGKIGDNILNWVKHRYAKNNHAWTWSDDIVFGGAIYILPTLLLIPLMFWLMKWFIIDNLLAKRGINETLCWIAIILVLRPMFFDTLTKVMKFKEEMKEKIIENEFSPKN